MARLTHRYPAKPRIIRTHKPTIYTTRGSRRICHLHADGRKLLTTNYR